MCDKANNYCEKETGECVCLLGYGKSADHGTCRCITGRVDIIESIRKLLNQCCNEASKIFVLQRFLAKDQSLSSS